MGRRAARRADMDVLSASEVGLAGLAGDHAPAGKRAVTLIQQEHLAVIAALAGVEVRPEMLRRNIVVSGINLLALRHREVRLGAVLLKISGPCPPCSRMEEVLGRGGYSAMRGHGGVYAEVLAPGRVAVGDEVSLAEV